MRKVAIPSAGDYSKLKFVEFDSLTAQDDEVLVQVSYAGVNYADCLVRFGVYASAKEYVGWPITPGFEVSGEVLSVGSKVRNFKKGDLVIGFTRFGGYSTHICLKESHTFLLPKSMTLAQGAAFPSVYATAYYCLLQIFNLPKNAKILVHSVAGGVGSALLQIAKAKNITVCGIVGSTSKIDYVKKMGCDFIYDKSAPGFSWEQVKKDHPQGFDAVYDANGYTTLKHSYELVRPTGKLVVYGAHSLLPKNGGRINYLKAGLGLLKTPRFNPLDMVTANKSLICFNVSFLFEEKDLIQENINQLLAMIESKQIAPPQVKEYLFDDVVSAHKAIESGLSVGKLVLRMK